MSLPFIDLRAQYQALKPQIQARIDKVLEHGQYIMGPEVAELEDRLAQFVGVKHCVTCASGTEALLISLLAAGIGPGDEVITTPFTFVATAEVMLLLGIVPVFLDIDPVTCNIDANKIEAAIGPKTRAIMPVSLYGQVADMDEINEIGKRHHLIVIEDAAQSFGATYRGRKSCALSTVGCTSFFPSKPLGCYGDGGACFTGDDDLAQAMREIRVHGQSKRYHHTRIGVGGRMDTLQCAIVLAKMERFEWEVAQRNQIGVRYQAMLDAIPQIRTVKLGAERSSVFAQMTIRTPKRDAMITHLNANGIPTAIHYPTCLHHQPAYVERVRLADQCAHAELAANEVLSLPMSADLTEAQMVRIVAAVADAAKAF